MAEGDTMNKSRPVIKKKGYIRILMLVILLVITIRSLIGISDNAMQTALVEYGDIRSDERAKGLVVRNETVIRAPISGKISYIAPENVKVPVNTKLLEITEDRIDEQLINQYNDIIRQLEASDLETADQANDAIMNRIANIADLIDQRNLLAVHREKERLAREVMVYAANNSRNAGREALIDEKNRLEGIIAEGVADQKALFPGIPVHTVDGYEEILHPAGIEKIDPLGIESRDLLKVDLKRRIEAGDPVLKLVDNFEWFIVVQLSKSFADGLKVGSVVSIEIEGQQDVFSVKASVCSIQEQEQHRIVALRITDYVPGMLDKRFIDISVVQNSVSGLVVPAKAVINGKQGPEVMVLYEGRTIGKRINIKGSDGNRIVVDSSQSGSELKLYDKVIINWEKFGGNAPVVMLYSGGNT
jgi:putative membrane fusion protein